MYEDVEELEKSNTRNMIRNRPQTQRINNQRTLTVDLQKELETRKSPFDFIILLHPMK